MWSDGQPEAVLRRGLNSSTPKIAHGFLNAIWFRDDLAALPEIAPLLIGLAKKANGTLLLALIGLIRNAARRDWEARLVESLLDRELSDDEARILASAIAYQFRARGDFDAHTISRVLDRLAVSQSLNDSDHGLSFFHEAARRYPRRMYEFMLKRVERQEMEHRLGNTGFHALPYGCRWRLEGIEKEPDFETLARDLFQRIVTKPEDQRWLWEELFRVVVSRTSPLTEVLITEHLPQLDNADDLADIASLLGWEGSLIVFRNPELTEAILRKARTLGADVQERITWKLIHGSGPTVRGYTNGELDPQYRYLRDEAEKAAKSHESNEILRSFYQKIVNMEIRDAERHRKEQDVDLADDW